MKKVVIYARVSSKDQEKEGFSIPAQQKLLKEYAKKNDFEIAEEFIDVETAKKAGRTNFNGMIEYLKKHKNITTILVEKTDRLYRNFKDYVLLEDTYEIHLVKEGVVLSEQSRSHEKLMHGFKVLIAKNFIDNLREETQKGMREKAAQGIFPSRAPYGYKNITNAQGKKDIEINEATAPFIKRAFAIYSKGGISIRATIEQLYDEGLFYRSYAPKITLSALEDMLKNPFYTGMFYFKGELMQGKHKPLVSKLMFEQTQRAFKKDNKSHYSKHEFVLGNFINCGDCGCKVLGEIKKQKYIYYHCTWGLGKDKCTQKTYYKEKELLDQLEAAVKAIKITEKEEGLLRIAIDELNKKEKEFYQEEIHALNQRAAKIREQIQKMYEDRLDGNIPYEFWQEQHNIKQNQLDTILRLINSHDKTNSKYMKEITSILELLKDCHSVYVQSSDKEKVNLLKILLSNCYLKDGKLSWEYNEPFSYVAKMTENKKILPRLDSNQQPSG